MTDSFSVASADGSATANVVVVTITGSNNGGATITLLAFWNFKGNANDTATSGVCADNGKLTGTSLVRSGPNGVVLQLADNGEVMSVASSPESMRPVLSKFAQFAHLADDSLPQMEYGNLPVVCPSTNREPQENSKKAVAVIQVHNHANELTEVAGIHDCGVTAHLH